MRDGPHRRVPSYLHPTAPADHTANFVGRISPSRTLYIPSKRHVRANHPRQKARYSQRWQEPSTGSFFCRSLEGERGARGGEGPERPPRCHAGGARSGFLFQRGQVALTLRCQVIALRNYPGIIPPPAQRGCAPRTGASFYHAFSPLRKAQAEAAPHALPQPAPGRASPVPAGPGGNGFLLPGAGLGSIAPPAKVCLPGVSLLKD